MEMLDVILLLYIIHLLLFSNNAWKAETVTAITMLKFMNSISGYVCACLHTCGVSNIPNMLYIFWLIL